MKRDPAELFLTHNGVAVYHVYIEHRRYDPSPYQFTFDPSTESISYLGRFTVFDLPGYQPGQDVAQLIISALDTGHFDVHLFNHRKGWEPELYMVYHGIRVYHVYQNGERSFYWYTLNHEGVPFDFRELPRPDHLMSIKNPVSQGVIQAIIVHALNIGYFDLLATYGVAHA